MTFLEALFVLLQMGFFWFVLGALVRCSQVPD